MPYRLVHAGSLNPTAIKLGDEKRPTARMPRIQRRRGISDPDGVKLIVTGLNKKPTKRYSR